MRYENITACFAFMCIVTCATGRADSAKTISVYDFDSGQVLDQLMTTAGVQISLTDKHVTSGDNALRIHVPALQETGDHYPRVILSSNIFTEPADYSPYTRISFDVTNTGEGLSTLMFGVSNLPHFDVHGQKQGSASFVIPSGATMTVSMGTSSLPRMDISVVKAMQFRIMTSSQAQTLVVDSIRAEYDPKAGSPLDTLREDALDLRSQYEAADAHVQMDNITPPQQEHVKTVQKQAVAELDTIVLACQGIAAGDVKGRHGELRQKVNELDNRIGRLVLLDKPALYAWEISPYVNVFRDELPDFESPALDSIAVSVAGGEYRDVVFMITGTEGPDQQAEIHVTDVTAPLKNAIVISKVKYIQNRLGEFTGDAHYPLEGDLKIPAGQSRQVRLAVDNRNGTLSSGNHAFTLVIQDQESGHTQHIPGRVHVHDFSLPGYEILPNNSYAEFNRSPFKGMHDMLVKDMKAGGYNVFYLHPMELPKLTSWNPDTGAVEVDSSVFDKKMKLILKNWGEGDPPRFIFSISAFTRTDRPEDLFSRLRESGNMPTFPDIEWKTAFAGWVTAFRNVVQEHGIEFDDWMITPADESSELALRTVDIPIAEIVKQVDSRIQLICNSSNITIFQHPEYAARYLAVMDIFQPDLGYGVRNNPDVLALRKNSGKPIWFYKCRGDLNTRSANIYSYYRLFTWDMMASGASGVGVWSYCVQDNNPWREPVPGYSMVYRHPEKEKALAYSRRYEIFREGMDDYRYVHKLRSTARMADDPLLIAQAEELIQSATIDILDNRYNTKRADMWREKLAEAITRYINVTRAASSTE